MPARSYLQSVARRAARNAARRLPNQVISNSSAERLQQFMLNAATGKPLPIAAVVGRGVSPAMSRATRVGRARPARAGFVNQLKSTNDWASLKDAAAVNSARARATAQAAVPAVDPRRAQAAAQAAAAQANVQATAGAEAAAAQAAAPLVPPNMTDSEEIWRYWAANRGESGWTESTYQGALSESVPGVVWGRTQGGTAGFRQSMLRAQDIASGRRAGAAPGSDAVRRFFANDKGEVGTVGRFALGVMDYYGGHGWGTGLTRAWGTYAALDAAGRVIGGGTPLRDDNGNFDIIGVPLF